MQDIKGVMKPVTDNQLCLDKLREAHAAGTSILAICVNVMLFVKVVLVDRAVHVVHAVHAVHDVHSVHSFHAVPHISMFEASLCTKLLFHEICESMSQLLVA